MELATGGTLFLDEVGEIPSNSSPSCFAFFRIMNSNGWAATAPFKVDLRLMAATNRDLAEDMALHEFRSDLFYRLSVFPIQVPL